MTKLRNIIYLLCLFQLFISCEEEQLVTEKELLGTWRFVSFYYDEFEYTGPKTSVCEEISDNLGDVWYINTDISCTRGETPLFGNEIIQWQFIDNCQLSRSITSRIYIDGNNLEVASYTFKVLSYNSSSLKLEVLNSSARDGFPAIPVGGKYTFTRD